MGARMMILSIQVATSFQRGPFLRGHVGLILTLSVGSSWCHRDEQRSDRPHADDRPERLQALSCHLVRQDLASINPSHVQR